MKWVRDLWVIGDEVLVIISKAKEWMQFSNYGWSRPFGDALDFDWVHLDSSIAHNDSEVFHLLLMELAFLGFKEKIIVFEFL